MLRLSEKYGFKGLEIAPGLFFNHSKDPFNLQEMKLMKEYLKSNLIILT